MPITIAGTGRALPNVCVSSEELDERLGLAPGALEDATGVRQRFFCGSESQIDLAVRACKASLDDAGLSPSDIGLLIFGSAVPYQPIPATAPIIMRELGIADGAAAAFDINSTCLSFLTAFETAVLQIEAGRCDTVLVVSSEIASRALPWDTAPDVAALFGDGAAALVLRKAGPTQGCVRASLMRTFPSAYEACSIGSGGTRFDFRREPSEFSRNATFHMSGRELFRVSSRHFSSFVADLLETAGWRIHDVEVVIPHQASPSALEHMARQVGVDREKLVDISRDYGNQIAASIPFALDIARKEGRISQGSKVLFLGTSAGVSFGGMALES
ncbi:ketoacyl-ACP synthase III [Agrobacterium tumefaciens]|uniref:3-oxoacyl-ACP synthase III family protein n=1 Tax=Agrobacterium tumefaciens TaxID=358 RepID=UPI001572BFAD|nr:3-oxoacyl-[acyl-carrier-protein] synthase III C-terminal domain-containing protein [Agrobacterium tumefaciens]NTE54443.1 ketoacyl-ACP synthase III [Agrobacterium tumefaciens]NTE73291.1 ketoacyl-ACP synthase III [Agrobacterium tumefaciens]